MKYLAINIVPICFIALAALFIYKETDGWGWCIFGAILTAMTYYSKEDKKEEIK